MRGKTRIILPCLQFQSEALRGLTCSEFVSNLASGRQHCGIVSTSDGVAEVRAGLRNLKVGGICGETELALANDMRLTSCPRPSKPGLATSAASGKMSIAGATTGEGREGESLHRCRLPRHFGVPPRPDRPALHR